MEHEKSKQMLKAIAGFKAHFYKKFNIDLIIVCRNLEMEILDGIPLEELKVFVNDCLWKVVLKSQYPEGIHTKTRKREIVVYRYCFIKLAYDMGYNGMSITRFLGWDHATVMHGRNTIKILLDAKNYQVINALNCIYDKLKIRSSNDGNVQPNTETGTDA